MKSRFTFDRESAAARNSVRTLVAALCVLGLVGLTLFHFDDGGGFANRFAKATLPETDGPVANSVSSTRRQATRRCRAWKPPFPARTSRPPMRRPRRRSEGELATSRFRRRAMLAGASFLIASAASATPQVVGDEACER